MIGIINLGLGNVSSVRNCLASIGKMSVVTDCVTELDRCSGYILPGVGTAGAIMSALNEKVQLKNFIIDTFRNDRKPILAICLGMQILFETSDEGNVECLGLIQGRVQRLKENICHIGWQNLDVCNRCCIQRGSFYFNHSYYVKTEIREENALMLNINGTRACVAIKVGKNLGVQFHPEKSQRAGMKLINTHFGS